MQQKVLRINILNLDKQCLILQHDFDSSNTNRDRIFNLLQKGFALGFIIFKLFKLWDRNQLKIFAQTKI